MADDVKVLITERNGTELAYHEEHRYHADNQPFDPTGSPFTATETEPAIKEAITLSGVALSLLPMGYKANAGVGKWLQIFAGNPSNTSPFVVAKDTEIVAYSFSNTNSITTTIGIYVNDVLVDSMSITASDTGTFSLITPIALVEGDRISAKITAGSTTNPVFVITMKGSL